MMTRIGVCSWSLEAEGAPQLAQRVRDCGVDALQLALDPVRTGVMPLDAVRHSLGEITLLSGMMAMAGEDYATLESIRRTGGIVPDHTWAQNQGAAHENARIARSLGIELVTFHAGFIPVGELDPARDVLLDRLHVLRDIFAAEGVRIALETGQEHAHTLRELLEQLPDVSVNFDPANMILYGMDEPTEALEVLLPRVAQVHVKDARRPQVPGAWGTEVPMGDGDVVWPTFLAVLQRAGRPIDLVIERESGQDRVGEVRRAANLLRELAG